jgi:hypothetical protein
MARNFIAVRCLNQANPRRQKTRGGVDGGGRMGPGLLLDEENILKLGRGDDCTALNIVTTFGWCTLKGCI